MNTTRPLSIALLILAPLAGSSQNLVLNGGFEDHAVCPDGVAQLDRATGWEVNALSPDYFNACATGTDVGVPDNFLGQRTAWEGEGYAGLITYVDSTIDPEPDRFRELIGRSLSEPLVPGVPVHLSMRVSPAFNGPEFSLKWACSGVGVRFTTGPLDPLDPAPPANDAALYLSEVLLDSTTWTVLSGTYVPDSAYDYVVVGNFFSDSLLNKTAVNEEANYDGAYTYVDAVCVSFDEDVCDNSTAVLQIDRPALRVVVDPSSTHIGLYFDGAVRERLGYWLMDGLGRIHQQGFVKSGDRTVELPTADLSAGAYHVVVTRPDGSVLANSPVCFIR